jgi:hypothetical protein
MGNLITKYKDFLFEADEIEDNIKQTRDEISKVHDEISAAKEVRKEKPNDINVEIDSIKREAAAYSKLPTLLNTLSAKLVEKSKKANLENTY